MSEYNDVTPLVFGRPGGRAAAEPEADDAGFGPEPAAADAVASEDAGAVRPELPEADLAAELDLDAGAPAEPADDAAEAAEAVEPVVEDAASHEEQEPSGELQLDLTSAAEARPSTYGHPEVDAVVERLDELDHLETADHIEVFEDAHRRLHETLLAAGNELADNTDNAGNSDNSDYADSAPPPDSP